MHIIRFIFINYIFKSGNELIKNNEKVPISVFRDSPMSNKVQQKLATPTHVIWFDDIPLQNI